MDIKTINIVHNNEINISEPLWVLLNANFSKDVIKQYISDTIENEQLELPYRTLDLDDAILDYQKLKAYDATNLVKFDKFFSRYDYKYSFNDVYFVSKIMIWPIILLYEWIPLGILWAFKYLSYT